MNIILEKLEKLKYSPYKQSPEGNIMAINAVLLHKVLLKVKPKNIIEIGFNQGHGATTILNSIPKTSTLKSIDIGLHECSHHNSNIVLEEYKNFSIDFGDSVKILNDVCYKIKPIDFAIIDGGHTYDICKSDMDICTKYISENGIIWLDDYRRITTTPNENMYQAPDVDRLGDEMRSKMNYYYYPVGGILMLSKNHIDFTSIFTE
jgi:predicted O-methyltransferase YrrM